jgi:hypothetical protein
MFMSGGDSVEPLRSDEVREALAILELNPDDLRCAYCGDPRTEWDHLRPLVSKKQPTGYISEIANLVPACGKCNQSKGSAHWETWMRGPALLSPGTRKIADLEQRVERLRRFETWRMPKRVDFAAVAGAEPWARTGRVMSDFTPLWVGWTS